MWLNKISLNASESNLQRTAKVSIIALYLMLFSYSDLKHKQRYIQVFLAVHGFLWLRWAAPCCSVWTSSCCGFSCCRWSTGCRRAVSGGCSMWACGILPSLTRDWTWPLHWQADSYPLRHQGSHRTVSEGLDCSSVVFSEGGPVTQILLIYLNSWPWVYLYIYF